MSHLSKSQSDDTTPTIDVDQQQTSSGGYPHHHHLGAPKFVIVSSDIKKRNSSNTQWVSRVLALTNYGEIFQLPDDAKPVIDDSAFTKDILEHPETRLLLTLFSQSPKGRHHSSVRVVDKIRTCEFSISAVNRSLRLKTKSVDDKLNWLHSFKKCLTTLNANYKKKKKEKLEQYNTAAKESGDVTNDEAHRVGRKGSERDENDCVDTDMEPNGPGYGVTFETDSTYEKYNNHERSTHSRKTPRGQSSKRKSLQHSTKNEKQLKKQPIKEQGHEKEKEKEKEKNVQTTSRATPTIPVSQPISTIAETTQAQASSNTTLKTKAPYEYVAPVAIRGFLCTAALATFLVTSDLSSIYGSSNSTSESSKKDSYSLHSLVLEAERISPSLAQLTLDGKDLSEGLWKHLSASHVQKSLHILAKKVDHQTRKFHHDLKYDEAVFSKDVKEEKGKEKEKEKDVKVKGLDKDKNNKAEEKDDAKTSKVSFEEKKELLSTIIEQLHNHHSVYEEFLLDEEKEIVQKGLSQYVNKMKGSSVDEDSKDKAKHDNDDDDDEDEEDDDDKEKDKNKSKSKSKSKNHKKEEKSEHLEKLEKLVSIPSKNTSYGDFLKEKVLDTQKAAFTLLSGANGDVDLDQEKTTAFQVQLKGPHRKISKLLEKIEEQKETQDEDVKKLSKQLKKAEKALRKWEKAQKSDQKLTKSDKNGKKDEKSSSDNEKEKEKEKSILLTKCQEIKQQLLQSETQTIRKNAMENLFQTLLEKFDTFDSELKAFKSKPSDLSTSSTRQVMSIASLARLEYDVNLDNLSKWTTNSLQDQITSIHQFLLSSNFTVDEEVKKDVEHVIKSLEKKTGSDSDSDKGTDKENSASFIERYVKAFIAVLFLGVGITGLLAGAWTQNERILTMALSGPSSQIGLGLAVTTLVSSILFLFPFKHLVAAALSSVVSIGAGFVFTKEAFFALVAGEDMPGNGVKSESDMTSTTSSETDTHDGDADAGYRDDHGRVDDEDKYEDEPTTQYIPKPPATSPPARHGHHGKSTPSEKEELEKDDLQHVVKSRQKKLSGKATKDVKDVKDVKDAKDSDENTTTTSTTTEEIVMTPLLEKDIEAIQSSPHPVRVSQQRPVRWVLTAPVNPGSIPKNLPFPSYPKLTERQLKYIRVAEECFPKFLAYADFSYRPDDWKVVATVDGVDVQSHIPSELASAAQASGPKGEKNSSLLSRGRKAVRYSPDKMMALVWQTETKPLYDSMVQTCQPMEFFNNHCRIERQIYKGFAVVSARIVTLSAAWQRIVFNDNPNAVFSSSYYDKEKQPNFENAWKYKNMQCLGLYDKYPGGTAKTTGVVRDCLPELAKEGFPTHTKEGYEYTRDGYVMVAVSVDWTPAPGVANPEIDKNIVTANLKLGGFFIRGVKLPKAEPKKSGLFGPAPAPLPPPGPGEEFIFGSEIVGLGSVDLGGSIPSVILSEVSKRQACAVVQVQKFLDKKADEIKGDFLDA